MARILETRYGVPEFAQLIAFGEIRRHHQDDFEGGPIEGLRLPALQAALPLTAVKFQRNDDREQRRDCPRLCLIIQHSVTIGSKGICPVKFILLRGQSAGSLEALDLLPGTSFPPSAYHATRLDAQLEGVNPRTSPCKRRNHHE